MVEQTRAEFGRIDILVNNAGIYRAAPTLEVTEEHWDAIMDINAKAVFFATQAVLPTMIEQKRGVIVSLAPARRSVAMRSRRVPRALPSTAPGDCGRFQRLDPDIFMTIRSSVCSSPFSRWSSRSTSLAWSESDNYASLLPNYPSSR